MPQEDPNSCLPPTPELCIDRPLSSISAASETATFYSAHDSYQGPDKSSLNGEIQASKWKKLNLSVSIPKMIREDSGYASNNDASPFKSSASPLSKKSKHNLKSNSRRMPRPSLHRRSSDTAILFTHSCQNYYYCQQENQAHHIISPSPRYHQIYCKQSQTHSIPNSPIPEAEDDSSHSFSGFSPLSPPSLPPQTLPSTMHYWTSDRTRRLEYEAIDAASKGLRGFLVRLLPDCILPDQVRRTRFWGQESQKRKREGSVRRYRLSLPVQHEDEEIRENGHQKFGSWIRERELKRSCRLRTWSTGLKFGNNMGATYTSRNKISATYE